MCTEFLALAGQDAATVPCMLRGRCCSGYLANSMGSRRPDGTVCYAQHPGLAASAAMVQHAAAGAVGPFESHGESGSCQVLPSASAQAASIFGTHIVSLRLRQLRRCHAKPHTAATWLGRDDHSAELQRCIAAAL